MARIRFFTIIIELIFFSVWAFSGNQAYRTSVTNTLYRCSNNNWCCSAGGNITSCCNDPGIENVLFKLDGSEISNGSAWASGLTLVPISAVQTTSLPTASMLTQSCPTQSCPPQTVIKESSETRKVGLAVGFGTGVPLFIAFSVAVVLLWRERRSSKLLRQQLSSKVDQPVKLAQTHGWKAPSEMPAREAEAIREMPTESGIVPELYANYSRR